MEYLSTLFKFGKFFIFFFFQDMCSCTLFPEDLRRHSDLIGWRLEFGEAVCVCQEKHYQYPTLSIYFYKMPVVFGVVKGMGALCVRAWGMG